MQTTKEKQAPVRTCIHCGSEVTGRADKKFCEDRCRTSYNNTRTRTGIKRSHVKSGIELITQERREQIEKHGWDLSHDEDYGNGELLKAARFCLDTDNEELWPWREGEVGLHFMRKIKNKTHQEKITVAAAFCAAELDRIAAVEEEIYNHRFD